MIYTILKIATNQLSYQNVKFGGYALPVKNSMLENTLYYDCVKSLTETKDCRKVTTNIIRLSLKTTLITENCTGHEKSISEQIDELKFSHHQPFYFAIHDLFYKTFKNGFIPTQSQLAQDIGMVCDIIPPLDIIWSTNNKCVHSVAQFKLIVKHDQCCDYIKNYTQVLHEN